MKYDVVIVGAGPAGSTVAKLLAENKINVLILDKCAFPRDKPCGGGLPIRVLQRFHYIKNTDLIESYSYDGCGYFSSFNRKVELHRNEPILAMVRRKKFDDGLLRFAIESGAQFLSGKTVIDVKITKENANVILDDGTVIDTEIIVGADGVWSTIAQKTGLCSQKRLLSLCVFQEYPLSNTVLDEFFSKNRMCHVILRFQGILGYGWVFPKKSHVNIGIDVVWIDPPKQGTQRNLKDVYKKFFVCLKEKKIIPADLEIGTVQGAALPLVPLEKTYDDRVLLCGDAAGFINPITGEGLYYAMASGELAAKSIIESLSTHDYSAQFLSKYQTMWKNDFGDDFKMFIQVNRRWEKYVEKLFPIVISDKILSEMILDIGIGRVRISDYRWKVIMRFLYVLVTYPFKRKKKWD